MIDKHVKDSFSELISYNRFEDEIILYLIYTLSLSAESVSIITLESIDESWVISIYDAKLHTVITFKLSDDHKNDLLFNFNYKIKKLECITKEQRKYIDGYLSSRKFLFSISQKTICKRFERKFGSKLKWFRFVPTQVSKLRKSALREIYGVYQIRWMF